MGKIKEIDEVIKIEKYKFPNNAVAIYDDKEILLKNHLPGEEVKATYKATRRGFQGRVTEVVKKSPMEIESKCSDFGICGGCTFQNITYENELEIKENMVLSLFDEGEISYSNYLGISKSPVTESYRNKMEYSFGDNGVDTPLSLGMRRRNSFYETVTAKYCNIVDDDYNKILDFVVEYFRNSNETFHHRKSKVGSLRHLLVRKGKYSQEILVALVTTSEFKEDMNKFTEKLLEISFDGKITGVIHIINDSTSDTVQSDNLNLIYGRDYIYDKLLGINFKISIFSFFQTNTLAAESLFTIVNNMLGDQKDSVVFDLYCGAGTITQVISKAAKKVIGVEIVEEAIESAKISAKENNITNVEFYADDVLKALDYIKDKPDFIILDPPRDGIHPKALKKIMNYGVDKIIYVSCKPTSLVRDLKVFEEGGYRVETLAVQDLFPRTYHVECVVLMSRVEK
ncbi:MAG: 23S rRNA (uracil(1939)-C(5))-methyltransferase RlmD [Lachnospirales bacterium]